MRRHQANRSSKRKTRHVSDSSIRQLLKRMEQRPLYKKLRQRLLIGSAILKRRWHNQIVYVGVTGSYGKTTTETLIAAVLSTAGECRNTRGMNLINGVANNMLSIGPSTKYCVQEVSGHSRETLRTSIRILRPQIGVVTVIGTDHYSLYRSPEATAEEKGRLVESLPSHGVAILNADDPYVRAMADRTRARVVTYGRSADADIRATRISSDWPDRLALTAIHGNDTVRIQTTLAGEHWTTSVLAAITCGLACGVDLATCARAIETCEPVFGRQSVHTKEDGPTYIVNHKASYSTIAPSLDFVKAARAPRKTAVLGTLADVPGRGSHKYRQVARAALKVADRVVFVGPNAMSVSKLLRQEELRERLFAVETSYQASTFLAETAIAHELIYVKASRGDHLERIMLSQLDKVVCWKERCGKRTISCPSCASYRKAFAPPFGLTHSE